jgi:predicted dehydrogenase
MLTSDRPGLNVLIIGCGNIAGAFDLGQRPDAQPYTHAGAYTKDGRFTISACVEPDETRRHAFMAAWGVPLGFSAMDELSAYVERFDVISICSPTICHGTDLEMALHLKPKLVFCEKPVTLSLAETERLVQTGVNFQIPIAVNYTRRWDPEVLQLREQMLAGSWGVLRSVVGIYNKGILNNGSHMLDLLHLLVGNMNLIKAGRAVYDYFPNDPTIPLWLESEQGVPVHLACADAGDYALAEFQFIFSHGVLTMENGGLFWRERRVVESDTFKGYRTLDEGLRRPGKLSDAMLAAVDNIYRVLTSGDALASTGATAFATQRLCQQALQMAERC